jgi:hypothetical protein
VSENAKIIYPHAQSQRRHVEAVLFMQKCDGTLRFITVILQFLVSIQTVFREFSAQAKISFGYLQD